MNLPPVTSEQVLGSQTQTNTLTFPRLVTLSNDGLNSTSTTDHTPVQKLSEHKVQKSKKQPTSQDIKQCNQQIKNLTENLQIAKQALSNYQNSTSTLINEINELFNSNNLSAQLQYVKNKLTQPAFSADVTSVSSKCKSNARFLQDAIINLDLSKLAGKSKEISGLIENFEVFQAEFNRTKESYAKLLQALKQKYQEAVEAFGKNGKPN